jgi:hypothetical protein
MGRLLPLVVHKRQDWPRAWRRPPRAASGPRPHTSVPSARHVQGLQRDAEGAPGLRRAARPMLSTLSFRPVRSDKDTFSGPCPHRHGRLFYLGASAHGLGHCLKGTSRGIATRLLRSPRQSSMGCRDRGLGPWCWPSQLPPGEAHAPQTRGVHARHRHGGSGPRGGTGAHRVTCGVGPTMPPWSCGRPSSWLPSSANHLVGLKEEG